MGRFTYANVMSTLALIVALAGSTTAVAAVIITDNSQVAPNTISGHAPPSGKHANLIAGSVNGTDLAAAYRTSLRVHCPAGMQRAADLCIEPALRPEQSYTNALATCALAGRRLPDQGDLAEAFNNLGASQDLQWALGNWFDFSVNSNYAPAMSSTSSRQIQFGAFPDGSTLPFRCVSTPVN
jgi:hypothetical protein